MKSQFSHRTKMRAENMLNKAVVIGRDAALLFSAAASGRRSAPTLTA